MIDNVTKVVKNKMENGCSFYIPEGNFTFSQTRSWLKQYLSKNHPKLERVYYDRSQKDEKEKEMGPLMMIREQIMYVPN